MATERANILAEWLEDPRIDTADSFLRTPGRNRVDPGSHMSTRTGTLSGKRLAIGANFVIASWPRPTTQLLVLTLKFCLHRLPLLPEPAIWAGIRNKQRAARQSRTGMAQRYPFMVNGTLALRHSPA